MKHNLFSKPLAAFGVLLCMGAGTWAAINGGGAKVTKFHVDVTGYAPADASGARAEVPVSADVYGDYSFKVTLPAEGSDQLNADKATVNVSMTGVQTLGLKDGETRSYSKTVETGIDGVTVSLTGFLSNAYAFQGATVPVTIKDGTSEAKFNYQIGGITDYTITGTPSSEDNARTAWHLITANVSASQDLSQNDTHFLFKRGAYILIGDEKLVIDEDYDFLKGSANLETLFDEARPYMHVEKNGLSGQAANKAVIYLPQGSTLGISSSAAVLTKDAILTVDATDKAAMGVTGIISGLRTKLSSNGGLKNGLAYMVVLFNQVIGMVDEAETVPVTLEFKKNKFHVDVTGYSAEDNSAVPVTVNADVYGDYSFDVSLPASGSDKLTASKATLNLRMSDVQTLGVSGTRSYSKTVNTGVNGVTVNLAGALPKTYAFNGASCPVTIKADGETKDFTYNIAGITADGHIVGTPSSSADAQAAWHLMTSKVTASQDTNKDDAHFLFKKGSYLQIGDEKLVFLDDFDFLKGAASMETLFDGAQVRIEKANVSGAATVKAAVYLPAGSTLGVSSSEATVSEDVKVTMAAPDGKATDANAVKGFFTDLSKKSSSLTAKTAIAALVDYFDKIVGMVDEADGAKFTVEFTEAKPVKFHVGVTGYKSDGKGAPTDTAISVNADVYNDYSFKVSLPDALNDDLSAAKATVNVSMTGVQSLGLATGETRSFSKTVETGITGVTAKLSGALENTYKFGGVKAPVEIVSGDTVKSFTYNIAGINEDYEIVGTPSDEAAAREAWWFMTSHVSAQSGVTPEDSHFLFKKGSYIQVGNEKLVFTNDFDFLKGGVLNSGATMQSLFENAEVKTASVRGDHSTLCKVYLPTGSTLGLSSSAATVTKDVTVSMEGASIASNAEVKNLFSTLKNSNNLTAQTAVAALIKAFDAVIGEVDKVDEVKFKVEFTEPKPVKFHVDVTGYDADEGGNAVAVNADVYNDYSFKVTLPDENNDDLAANRATVNVSMTGVQSLGLKDGETRSYKKDLTTGVTGVKVALAGALENTYKFGGVECPVEIVSGDTVKSFTYSIAGINDDYEIVGTPSDTEKAREAWWFMVSHVKAQSGVTPEDSHFLFKKGAYLQVGNEKLLFVNDFDFLKGSASMETLFKGARVVPVTKTDGSSTLAKVFLPAGSTLGLSSSAATVTKDVTVSMDGANIADNQKVKDLFSGLQSNGNLDAKTAIAALVYAFDAVIGEVDAVEKVSFKVEFTEPETPKFHVDVTGYDADDLQNGVETPIAVNADVYGDYHFVVSLPFSQYDNLSASKATLNMSMTGVQSLGLATGETRTYSKTVDTGVDAQAKLSGALKNTYAFSGAACPVTIKDAKDTKKFTYNIAAVNEEMQIIGTPSSEQAARDAWQFMVNSDHVSASKVAVDDTHMLFKQGAYLQIGDERLVFLKDFDFLKGTASMENLFDGAQVRIEKANVSGQNTVKAAVYLPAGSTLGVSSSAATAVEDVKVTMDAVGNAKADTTITNVFSNLASGSKLTAKAAIALLVSYFDEVVGLVDNYDGVNFTVEFTEAKPVKFHADVTGYQSDGTGKATDTEIKVGADVFNDYSFEVSLPDVSNDNLSAEKATVNISMTGVQTLGLKDGETRSYTKTVETGIDNVTAPLHKFLTNTYSFDKAVVCPVTVKDASTTEQFTYNIAALNEDYKIVGTPSDTEKARAAWHLLTSKVSATQNLSTNDTHFLFKKGAYIQIGDEKLVFLKDFDFLKGTATTDKLFDEAKGYVQIKAVDGDDALKSASVYLPVGSTLGVSSSAAALTEDVTVTMAFANATDAASKVFNTLKTSSVFQQPKLAIAGLVTVFDKVVGLVKANEGASFTVEFAENEARTPKFHVGVTGYDFNNNDFAIPVTADVFGDYSFDVALPDAKNDTLTASKATLDVTMTGVQTLGLKDGETRSYTKTVETGVTTSNGIPLDYFLGNVYGFQGVTAPVDVIADGQTTSFTYNIAGITDDYHIIGTPDNEDNARAAWHVITSKVNAESGVTPEDTHFLFKKGAFLQIGDEKLVFTDDFDFLKGAASMETLFDGAKTRIEKVNYADNDTRTLTATAYLPAGSTLGISSSAATVSEDVYVTMDAQKANGKTIKVLGSEQSIAPFTGFFTNLKKSGNLDAKTAIAALVVGFDAVVGAADAADNVKFTVEFANPTTPKFHVDVTGYEADSDNNATDTEIKVNADVYGDYHFVVALPDTYNDNLSTSKATLNVSMTNVATLGVSGTRSYTKTVETGLNGSAKLSAFLTSTYRFGGVTAPVTIKDGDESKSFTYNIAAIDSAYQIIGKPDDEAAAREAWHFMVNDDHLTAQGGVTPEDTHFLFKKGAYIQVGNEKLVFTDDFDFLKGTASMENLFEGAQVEQKDAADGSNTVAKVYLPAGSTLGMSSSAATVKKNVTITMDGADIASNEKVQNVFSNLKNGGNLNAKAAILALVQAFDDVIGAVDAADEVKFTVEFTKPEVKVNDDTKNVTLETLNLADGETSTEKANAFTVSGTNLNDAITLAVLHGSETGFSVEPASVEPTDGTVGSTAVKVTFSPTAAGEYKDTVMVTSTDADTLYVYLSAAKAGPVQYKNTASDEWLTMLPDANNTYNINGDELYAFRVNGPQEGVNVNLTRTYRAGVWIGWMAPFDMEVTEDLLSKFKFCYLEGVSNEGEDIDKDNMGYVSIGTKTLKAGDVVKANLPYVVKPVSSGQQTISVSNVTLQVTNPVPTRITGNAYYYTSTGVYTTKQASEQDYGWYSLTHSTGTFSLRTACGGIKLEPFNFYLTITDRDDNPYKRNSKPMNIRIVELDDMTTGINSISNDADGEQKIYDLQGRRVHKPTMKGVYIVNGRKVVLGK